MDHRIEDLRVRLDGIAEELTDVSVDLLREALEAGATERPAMDRKLARARRAVEKAARLLEPERDDSGPA